MNAPTSPVVMLERVGRRFGAQVALEAISTCIRPGEFVAVIGRSGAGKTTLLRCLSRALVPTDGTIRIGGVDLRPLRLRPSRAGGRHLPAVQPGERPLDNVLVGRLPHLRGWRRYAALVGSFDRAQREVALRCLDHVGLLARAWQRSDTLSGGEQQRVAIAKILAQEPELILGDEPVASLDVMNGALVMETLRQIATGVGLTVISTLHHVEYARRYADRVLGLRDGRLVFDGPARELSDGAVREIFGLMSPSNDPGGEPASSLAEPTLVAS
jgi:phosphonate transport system ATP-binding protein